MRLAIFEQQMSQVHLKEKIYCNYLRKKRLIEMESEDEK